MHCDKCGEILEDGSHFCSYCGESLTRKPVKSTVECGRCGGTGKIIDELGFKVHCPVCKGFKSKEEV